MKLKTIALVWSSIGIDVSYDSNCIWVCWYCIYTYDGVEMPNVYYAIYHCSKHIVNTRMNLVINNILSFEFISCK